VDTSTGAAFLEAIRTSLPNLRLLTDPLDLEGYRRDETAYLEPPPPLDEQPVAITATPASAAVSRAVLGCRGIDVMCPEPSSMTGGT